MPASWWTLVSYSTANRRCLVNASGCRGNASKRRLAMLSVVRGAQCNRLTTMCERKQIAIALNFNFDCHDLLVCETIPTTICTVSTVWPSQCCA